MRLPIRIRLVLPLAVASFLAICAMPAAFTSLVVKAQSASGIDDVLSKTHAEVAQFAEQFSLIRYEEDFVQQKLKNNDRVAYKQETFFDSIIRVRFDDGKMNVDEQRLAERLPRKPESRPLMSTYGFSTLAMIFHPYYESSFHFTDGGVDSLDGKALTEIHFVHIPETPTPVLYQMVGADKPMEVSGTAWVDPATGDIYRIQADLDFNSDNIGIKKIRADVAFSPVTLKGKTSPEILPSVATIDLETAKQHWRNIHRYSDYRAYRVSTNFPGADSQ